MRPIGLLAGPGADLLRRVAARVPWEVVPGGDFAALRRIKVAVASSPEPARPPELHTRIRACRPLEGVEGAHPDLDLVVVTGDAGDLAHTAFSHAAMQARRKVTVINDDPAFLEAARKAAPDYRWIQIEERSLAEVGEALPRDPAAWDVLLCGGPGGGGLADTAARLAGGARFVADGWVGGDMALYLPAAAGPVALILAAALALERINEHQYCERLRKALNRAEVTRAASPAEAAERVIAAL